MDQARAASCRYLISHGPSMQPLVPPGKILRVIPVALAEVRLGDLLVFERADHRLVCHRVVRIVVGGFWCKGDACHYVEEVLSCQVVGRVTSVDGQPVPRAESPARLYLRAGWYSFQDRLRKLKEAAHVGPLVRSGRLLWRRLRRGRSVSRGG